MTLLICCCFTTAATAQQYSIDDLNRTVFLYPDFYKGKVLFKDKSVQEAIFNYNTLFQQMIFVQNGVMMAMDKESTIDTVYVDTLLFVPVDTFFYEVKQPYSPLPLFINYKAEVIRPGPAMPFGGTSETGAVQNVSSYRTSVATPYQSKVPDTYEVRKFAEYYIKSGAGFVQLKSFKQLKQLYRANEDEISDFIKENHISFNKTADMEKLVLFLGAIRK